MCGRALYGMHSCTRPAPSCMIAQLPCPPRAPSKSGQAQTQTVLDAPWNCCILDAIAALSKPGNARHVSKLTRRPRGCAGQSSGRKIKAQIGAAPSSAPPVLAVEVPAHVPAPSVPIVQAAPVLSEAAAAPAEIPKKRTRTPQKKAAPAKKPEAECQAEAEDGGIGEESESESDSSDGEDGVLHSSKSKREKPQHAEDTSQRVCVENWLHTEMEKRRSDAECALDQERGRQGCVHDCNVCLSQDGRCIRGVGRVREQELEFRADRCSLLGCRCQQTSLGVPVQESQGSNAPIVKKKQQCWLHASRNSKQFHIAACQVETQMRLFRGAVPVIPA